jgi:hypothetical protein
MFWNRTRADEIFCTELSKACPGFNKYNEGRGLVEKLVFVQLLKKYLACYGNRTFISS